MQKHKNVDKTQKYKNTKYKNTRNNIFKDHQKDDRWQIDHSQAWLFRSIERKELKEIKFTKQNDKIKTIYNKNDTLTNRPNLQRQCVQNKSICRTETYQSSIDKKSNSITNTKIKP